MKLRLILSLGILAWSGLVHGYDVNAPECKVIKMACDSAGYKPGGFLKGYKKPKKAPAIDCLKKITDGERVEGVSVAAQTIAACKNAKGSPTAAAPVQTAPASKMITKKDAIPPKKK